MGKRQLRDVWIKPGLDVQADDPADQRSIMVGVQEIQNTLEQLVDRGFHPETLVISMISALCTLIAYGSAEIRKKYCRIFFSKYFTREVAKRRVALGEVDSSG